MSHTVLALSILHKAPDSAPAGCGVRNQRRDDYHAYGSVEDGHGPRPNDAETVLFNALANSLTLGPFTWDGDQGKEEELEDMVARILASLLQYYQKTKKGESLYPN